MENGGDPLILRRTLIRDGSTDSDIRRAKSDGTITPIRRGAFANTTRLQGLRPEDRHVLDVRAHASASKSALVVSHTSAAIMHGIPMWSPDLSRVHLTTNGMSGGRRTATRHIHAAPIESRDVVKVNGIYVTSPARTVADLARTLQLEGAVCVGDAALKAKLTTVDDIRDALSRHRGRGSSAAEGAIDFLRAESESVGESRSRVLLNRMNFLPPELQVPLFGSDGKIIARTDFLWPDQGVVGEFDGAVKYSVHLRPGERPENAVMREKEREDMLRSYGWVVVRWTWADLDRPDAFAALLQRAFDRAAELPAPRTFGSK